MKKETKVYSGSLEIRERCKTPEDRRSLLNIESIDSRLLKDLRSVEPYGNEPISIDSKSYKVCYNRGNARIWIEGKRLIDNGINNGLKFVKSVNDYGIVLKFLPAEYEGKSHKVAGSVERPIIDLNGKYLTKFFGDAKSYKVTFWKGLNLHYILIEKA